MKERPIPFSAAMVRALLDGTKTETRRICMPQPARVNPSGRWYQMAGGGHSLNFWGCPYGEPGDVLWVREAWRVGKGYDEAKGSEFTSPAVMYEATREDALERWPEIVWGRHRAGRFMPRWAARIELEVKSYRVERLHDMREWDAVAEGIAAPESEDEISALGAFQELWLSLNGPGSWVSNPFVWVVEFNRRIS